MECDNLLTIILPTYNRAELLDKNLGFLAKLQEKNSFSIIICNNGSTDNTVDVINKWKEILQYTQIVNQNKNVLYDRNVASGYKLVQTAYCWLLGDSCTIDSYNFDTLLSILKLHKPQALIIDAYGQVGMPDCIYNDPNALLSELGWYMTLLSSCIIKKEFINQERCERFYDTNFIHEGVFFDYLASVEDFEVVFTSSVRLNIIVGNKSATSWAKTPFRIFGKTWFAFIMSLPNKYTLESKLCCIKMHDNHSRIFSPSKLIKKKISGYCSFEDYREARPIMRFVSNHPLFLYDIISLIPSCPKFVDFIKRLNRR